MKQLRQSIIIVLICLFLVCSTLYAPSNPLVTTSKSCEHNNQCETKNCVDNICKPSQFGGHCTKNEHCVTNYCDLALSPPSCAKASTGGQCEKNSDCGSRKCDTSRHICKRNDEDGRCTYPGDCSTLNCENNKCGPSISFEINPGCDKAIQRDGAIAFEWDSSKKALINHHLKLWLIEYQNSRIFPPDAIKDITSQSKCTSSSNSGAGCDSYVKQHGFDAFAVNGNKNEILTTSKTHFWIYNSNGIKTLNDAKKNGKLHDYFNELSSSSFRCEIGQELHKRNPACNKVIQNKGVDALTYNHEGDLYVFADKKIWYYRTDWQELPDHNAYAFLKTLSRDGSQRHCFDNNSLEINPGCDSSIINNGVSAASWTKDGSQFMIFSKNKMWTYNTSVKKYVSVENDISKVWRETFTPTCIGCQDSDGFDAFKKGTVTTSLNNSLVSESKQTHNDICLNKSYVREWTCSNEAIPKPEDTNVFCPFGCYETTCNKPYYCGQLSSTRRYPVALQEQDLWCLTDFLENLTIPCPKEHPKQDGYVSCPLYKEEMTPDEATFDIDIITDENCTDCGKAVMKVSVLKDNQGEIILSRNLVNQSFEKIFMQACINPRVHGHVGIVCVESSGEHSVKRPSLNLPPFEDNEEGTPRKIMKKISYSSIPGLAEQEYPEAEEPANMNTNLLNCPEYRTDVLKNYANLADYVDKMVTYYSNFLSFYKNVFENLDTIYRTLESQCSSCENEVDKFNKKYASCSFSVATNAIPFPEACVDAAKKKCNSDSQCKKSTKSDADEEEESDMCSMCGTIPCNRGVDCKLGVPTKHDQSINDPFNVIKKDQALCWSNIHFCGQPVKMGEDDYGVKGCDTGLTESTASGVPICCIPPVINDPLPISQIIPPQNKTTPACYRQGRKYGEAWSTLITEKGEKKIDIPAKVIECTNRLADLKDLCELGINKKVCLFKEEVKKSHTYLKTIIDKLPEYINQLSSIKTKLSSGLEHGQVNTTIKAHIDEIESITSKMNIQSLSEHTSLNSEQFQILLTEFVDFLRSAPLQRDLKKEHIFKLDVPFLKGDEKGYIEFPVNTHPSLIYKQDYIEKWDEICLNYNVIKEDQRGIGSSTSTFDLLLAEREEKETPILGCGGYPGGCVRNETEFTIRDRNIDLWPEPIMNTVDAFASLNTKKLFINAQNCFNYVVPMVSMCEDVCKMCFKTTQTHCHKEKGVCICELGTQWHPTSFSCNEIENNQTKREEIKSCCNLLFNNAKETNSNDDKKTKSGKNVTSSKLSSTPIDSDYCSPNPSVLAGITFDKCQFHSSDTGYCCKYGFEEKPANKDCLKNNFCSKACKDKIPQNEERLLKCNTQCVKKNIDCEKACFNDFLENKNTMRHCFSNTCKTANSTAMCIKTCYEKNDLTQKEKDACAKVCKVLEPKLDIEIDIIKFDIIPSTVFSKDNVKLRINIKNRGLFPYYGKLDVFLKQKDKCQCPPCPSYSMCPCNCKNTNKLMKTVSILLEESQTKFFDTEEINIPLAWENSFVQAFIQALDEFNEVIKTASGKNVKVIGKTPVILLDAYFSAENRTRTNIGYVNETVLAHYTIESDHYPLSVKSYLIVNNKEIDDSINHLTINKKKKDLTITTSPLKLTQEFEEDVLLQGITIRYENGSVAMNSVLKAINPNMIECNVKNLTSHCNDAANETNMLYPSAFLEVKKPELKIKDAYFLNEDNKKITETFGDESISGEIIIEHSEEKPFIGSIELGILESNNITVAENKSKSIKPKSPIYKKIPTKLRTQTIITRPGTTYTLFIKAIEEKSNKVWLYEIPINSKLFSKSQIITDDFDPNTSGGSSFFQMFSYEICKLSYSCENVFPMCNLYIDSSKCNMSFEHCGQCRLH